MRFDFDKIYDRRDTGCSKWDYLPYPNAPEGSIPMWVADMDFAAAPSVIAAMEERLQHPLMGYFKITDRVYNALINWQKRRYGVTDLEKKHITYHNGVIGGFTAAIDTFTKPGDPILVEAPGYPMFQKSIDNTGRVIVPNELIETQDGYTFDFAATEALIKEKNIKFAIFCNPHNPTGRNWSREEISAYIDICDRNGVIVVADEIWADVIIDKNTPFVPFFSLGEKAKKIGISFYSPTKGFNIAGLVASFSIIYNDELREKINATAGHTHYNSPSALAIAAVLGAYEGGDEWLEACNAYMGESMDYVIGFLAEKMPKIKTTKPSGTYLLWLDFSDTGLSHEEILNRCTYKAGVIMNDGTAFVKNGEKHMRMNMATPRSNVITAMDRLYNAFSDVAK